MKVLITGASGTIGRQLIDTLQQEYDLCLVCNHSIREEGNWHQVDVTNLDELMGVMGGVDAVIHLAIASGHEGDYEEDGFNDTRFDVNVKGTFHVFEAAKRAGVKRVIYTSSLTVVWGAEGHVDGDAPAVPVGTYALTKHLGEQIGQYYAQQHQMSVICLRIPKPIDIADLETRKMPILPQWIAFPDLMQAYRLALTVPNIGFETLTVVGESSKRRWDISRAQSVLGYEPQFRLEELGYTLRDEPSAYDREGVVWNKGNSEDNGT